MLVRLYVGGVAVAATVMGVVAAVSAPSQQHSTALPVLFLLALLLCLTEFLQLRQFHYRDQGASHNLIEGVIVTLLVAASAPEAMVVVAVALLVADAARRTPVIKLVFNSSQWLLAAACGSLVLHVVAPPGSDSGHQILGVALACVTMSVVNHAALGTVLRLATRSLSDAQGREGFVAGIVGRLIANIASLVTGLALVAAYRWSPYLLLLGAVFIVGLDSAGRGFASLRTDRVRLEGMQRATHALATANHVAQGLPAFLAETRVGFEVQQVELVLFSDREASDRESTVHRCTGTVETGYSQSVEAHALADALASTLTDPVHLGVANGGAIAELLEAKHHSRVLAAPLQMGGSTIGILFLYDRLGVDGFEAGELKIADALSREIVGFLERVELLQAIDGERRKLADILGNTSDGIFSIDADATITSWNAGLAAMTGYAADEVVGTRHFGLLRPRDTAGRDVLLERWVETYETPAGLPADLQIVSAAGQTVWLSCSYSRIPAGADDRRDVLVVVARNVTQARELERLKDDFVAVVSHELRTPLVPIKGWAQTLLNRGDRLSDDQRRTAVQSILAQAQKLESLVLNILEASRIEAGRIDGDGTADVGAIGARLVEDIAASRPDRAIRLRPPAAPCNVNGSAVWVERALSNLLSNAVKYSPDDEPVDVVITTDGTSVVAAVTDRGPGIATDAQERIFQRFERLEETRTQTGTGLGLYITRRLARAMGGDVTVSSLPGAGSTFLLRLPLAPVSAAKPPAPASLPEQRGRTELDGNVVRLR